jgi:hypothetical protein
MEFFHGFFEESDLDIEPDDTDEFAEFEEQQRAYFIKANGQLYRIWSSDLDVDYYGFAEVLEPTDKRQLMLYWYNGGGSLKEVAGSAIKRHLKKKKNFA